MVELSSFACCSFVSLGWCFYFTPQSGSGDPAPALGDLSQFPLGFSLGGAQPAYPPTHVPRPPHVACIINCSAGEPLRVLEIADTAVERAATVLRLMYIIDMKDLQAEIDRLLVRARFSHLTAAR